MMKAVTLGKVTHKKLLIFDMDETLIAAKFHNRLPAGFETTFTISHQGEQINVSTRPYLQLCLETLS